MGLHPRSSSPRFMALLAAVHQALKAERPARQTGRMAMRTKQRRSPAHHTPEASSIGVPPASAACGAKLSSRCANGPACLLGTGSAIQGHQI